MTDDTEVQDDYAEFLRSMEMDDASLEAMWKQAEEHLRSQGFDPDEVLRKAGANVDAWYQHGKVCNWSCDACKKAINENAIWLDEVVELPSSTEPKP